MTFTDTINDVWQWFNNVGWPGLLVLVVCGFALRMVYAAALFMTDESKTWGRACGRAVLVFIGASVLVFGFMYKVDGHLERHLFGEDVWRIHWRDLVFHQVVASVPIGIAVLFGLHEGWGSRSKAPPAEA